MSFKALYVVFEGIDGSGKTSQAKRLIERVKAAKLFYRGRVEPSEDGPVGQEIRRRLREGPPLDTAEAFGLFVADRRWGLNKLQGDLVVMDVVVQDRSYFSTAVYQSGTVPTLTMETIVEYHEHFMPRPDLVILLDLDADTACKRIESRGGRSSTFEDSVALIRARGRYMNVLYHSFREGRDLIKIDASRPADEVEDRVWAIFTSALTDKNIARVAHGA